MTDTLNDERPRSAAERRPRRRVLPLIVGLVLGVFLTSVVGWLDGDMNRWTVLEKHTQPASVRYSDDSVHHLGVVETRGWVFGRHRAYQLVVGRDPSMSYGHVIELGITGSDRPRIQKVGWEAAGVRIGLGSGHEMFVPARYFMNGR